MSDTTDSSRPPRVRVTAPRPGEALDLPGDDDERGPAATSSRAPADAERLLVRSLMRSQLRVAIVSALGFVLALAAIGVLAALPALQATLIAGVPAGWLVLGFAAFPPLVAVAGIATLAANRTEAQYRELTGADDPEGGIP